MSPKPTALLAILTVFISGSKFAFSLQDSVSYGNQQQQAGNIDHQGQFIGPQNQDFGNNGFLSDQNSLSNNQLGNQGGGGGGDFNFPLPECYKNKFGYMCCNVKLEELVVTTVTTVINKKAHSECNTHQTAKTVQFRAQTVFSTRFETVASLDDFAYATNFLGNMTCKIKHGGQYVLAYATPDKQKIAEFQQSQSGKSGRSSPFDIGTGDFGSPAVNSRPNVIDQGYDQQNQQQPQQAPYRHSVILQ